MKITSLKAKEIPDSRGNPTIEVECGLSSGVTARASVPSGKSTGVHEASVVEPAKAAAAVNGEIFQTIRNRDLTQESLDRTLIELDGYANKSRLGANALLGVSLSFARANATSHNLELYEYIGKLMKHNRFTLPYPALNIINGGKHSQSGLDLQEYMIVPQGFNSFKKKIEVGQNVIENLHKLLVNEGFFTEMGDEGGFAPKLPRNEDALKFLVRAITDSGYSTDSIKIALDAAASSFYREGKYHLKIDGKDSMLTSEELIDWYKKLVAAYPIISIEDGLAEDDWEGFAKMKQALPEIMVVGDDLTVTNVKRITEAHEHNAINAVLIKPNQIGTLTETLQAITLTYKYGWTTFASHRSGETEDTFIADLAIGAGCTYLKAGSPTRKERVVKYERLIAIEEKL